jgi:hypothetical protein
MRTNLAGPWRLVTIFLGHYTSDTVTNRALLEARRVRDKGNKREHTDSTELLLGLIGHESHGRNGGTGHQGQIEVAAGNLEVCGKIPAIMDGVVGATLLEAQFRANAVWQEGAKAIFRASLHDFVYGNHGMAPYYEVTNQVTDATGLNWQTAAADTAWAYDPGWAAFDPDPQYHCTRLYY